MAIPWREAGDGQEHWLMPWGWLKSDQTCTQANMLAMFPLAMARDRRWWSRCPSLGSPEMSTSFFARQLKRRGQWTCHTHQWFRLQLVESNNCQEGHCLYFRHLLVSASVATLLGIAALTMYVVTFCKGVHNCPIQGSYLCTRGSGSNHQAFYLSSGQRAQGQKGDQCRSMIVWGWSLWLNVWGSGPHS